MIHVKAFSRIRFEWSLLVWLFFNQLYYSVPKVYVLVQKHEKESASQSSLKGRERAIINQTNVGPISKATLGKLLRDRVEHLWVFPSTQISSWTELNYTWSRDFIELCKLDETFNFSFCNASFYTQILVCVLLGMLICYTVHRLHVLFQFLRVLVIKKIQLAF